MTFGRILLLGRSIGQGIVSICTPQYAAKTFHSDRLSLKETIVQKLALNLEPEYLNVQNLHDSKDSRRNLQFKIVVVSRKFEGLSISKRHRLVNNALRDELKSGIHHLSLVTQTPQQWSAQSKSSKMHSEPGARAAGAPASPPPPQRPQPLALIASPLHQQHPDASPLQPQLAVGSLAHQQHSDASPLQPTPMASPLYQQPAVASPFYQQETHESPLQPQRAVASPFYQQEVNESPLQPQRAVASHLYQQEADVSRLQAAVASTLHQQLAMEIPSHQPAATAPQPRLRAGGAPAGPEVTISPSNVPYNKCMTTSTDDFISHGEQIRDRYSYASTKIALEPSKRRASLSACTPAPYRVNSAFIVPSKVLEMADSVPYQINNDHHNQSQVFEYRRISAGEAGRPSDALAKLLLTEDMIYSAPLPARSAVRATVKPLELRAQERKPRCASQREVFFSMDGQSIPTVKRHRQASSSMTSTSAANEILGKYTSTTKSPDAVTRYSSELKGNFEEKCVDNAAHSAAASAPLVHASSSSKTSRIPCPAVTLSTTCKAEASNKRHVSLSSFENELVSSKLLRYVPFMKKGRAVTGSRSYCRDPTKETSLPTLGVGDGPSGRGRGRGGGRGGAGPKQCRSDSSSVEDSVKRKLISDMTPEYIEVSHCTRKSLKGYGYDTYLKIFIVSEKFADLSVHERHRLLDGALGEELISKTKRLKMVAQTPEEWRMGGVGVGVGVGVSVGLASSARALVAQWTSTPTLSLPAAADIMPLVASLKQNCLGKLSAAQKRLNWPYASRAEPASQLKFKSSFEEKHDQQNVSCNTLTTDTLQDSIKINHKILLEDIRGEVPASAENGFRRQPAPAPGVTRGSGGKSPIPRRRKSSQRA